MPKVEARSALSFCSHFKKLPTISRSSTTFIVGSTFFSSCANVSRRRKCSLIFLHVSRETACPSLNRLFGEQKKSSNCSISVVTVGCPLKSLYLLFLCFGEGGKYSLLLSLSLFLLLSLSLFLLLSLSLFLLLSLSLDCVAPFPAD